MDHVNASAAPDSLSGRALRFLKENGIDEYDTDFAFSLLQRFGEEMEAGLNGRPSSLAMLPTYLKTGGTLPEEVPVLVLDAGGTNLRLAILRQSGGGWQILREEQVPMPGSQQPLEKAEYLEEMVRLLGPFTKGIEHVGYCFSYAAVITPEKDGILDCFNKGVTVKDSAGMKVCKELKAALRRAGCHVPAHWVLLNDSVATCFGAQAGELRQQYDGIIGFVLGTGTNTCYSERVERMHHYDLSGYPNEEMLLNMECGAADIFPMSRFDEMLHADDPQPGVHIYEKMVSGAYLGRLIWYAAKEAARSGLFSDAAAKALGAHPAFTTREISEYLANEDFFLPEFEEEDDILFHLLCTRIVQRAALFIAVNLAGVALFRGLGKDRRRPALVIAEGSTFWRFPTLKESVRAFLNEIARLQKGPYLEITSTDRANLYGSAAAALLNS